MAFFPTSTGGLFDGMNIFGTRQPEYLGGLLSPEELQKVQNQSLLQGVLGTAATYLAQPKNQGYGSVLPYLGKAYLGGMQASQGAYDTATQNLLTKGKLAELAREAEKAKIEREAINELVKDPTIANDPVAKAAILAGGVKTGLDYIRPPISTDRDAYATANYGKTFAKLTSAEQKDVLKQLQDIKLQAAPYYQAVPTEEGYARFNARTGNLEPLIVGGKQVLPAAYSPTLQGAIKAEEATATSKAKKVAGMEGASDIINQAEMVLKGQKVNEQGQIVSAPKPTQSGIGTLVDISGAVFGKTPQGAAEADKLKALGGQLVSKMPRMEGPQSDYDVQNYKEMAGRVGDSTLPIERRLAALETVKQIVQKYEPLNQPKTQSKNVVRTGKDKSGRTVIQYSDGSLEYAN